MQLKQQSFRHCVKRITLCFGIALTVGHLAFAQAPKPDPECSLAKANKSCTLTIDRRVPLTPPTIQMYPGTKLTVQIRDPYYFERYYMDYVSGQVALAPDVASSVVNGLLTPLQKLAGLAAATACTDHSFDGRIPAAAGDIEGADALYTGCLKDFSNRARDIYRRLEPPVYPDSHPAGGRRLLRM